MLDCLILGDSIAVGTHQFKQECVAYAKGGINSWQFNKKYEGDFLSDVVIISLGSNDHKGVHTRKELEALRNRVIAKSKVFWILPHGNNPKGGIAIEEIQEIVESIAKLHNDTVLPITRVQKDNIHPSWAGYKDLAEKSK
jgi:lysophospholipase L1-like esterase